VASRGDRAGSAPRGHGAAPGSYLPHTKLYTIGRATIGGLLPSDALQRTHGERGGARLEVRRAAAATRGSQY
jgi:hypothetical protein